jgi:hypothetical protein
MKTLPVLIAAALLVVACGAPDPRPRTVEEFVEDPAVLQGVVIRCSARRSREHMDPECANAFAAVETIAKAEEQRRAADREANFERSRERRRVLDEQRRADAERAAPKFDPYSSPVVDPSPAAAGTPDATAVAAP